MSRVVLGAVSEAERTLSCWKGDGNSEGEVDGGIWQEEGAKLLLGEEGATAVCPSPRAVRGRIVTDSSASRTEDWKEQYMPPRGWPILCRLPDW